MFESIASHRRAVTVGLVVPVLLLGATACSSTGSSSASSSGSSSTPTSGSSNTPTSGKNYNIGVLIKDTTIPFFGRQIQGYKDAAQKYGMTVQIYNGKGDNGTQVALVQQMVTKNENMIIVTPGDPQAITGALQQAKAANIPVMAVNSSPNDTADLISFVGADDLAYGKGLGNLIVKATGGSGNVGLIRGKLGDPPDRLRRDGIESVLKAHPGIKIVAEQTANWDAATTLSVTQDFLSRFQKGKLDAVVDVGPEAASGATYAHANGRSEVKFIVGDFPSNVKNGIEDGSIFGAVNQDPYTQSYTAMGLVKKYLDGDKSAVKKTVYLPLPEVTKENVSKFEPAW